MQIPEARPLQAQICQELRAIFELVPEQSNKNRNWHEMFWSEAGNRPWWEQDIETHCHLQHQFSPVLGKLSLDHDVRLTRVFTGYLDQPLGHTIMRLGYYTGTIHEIKRSSYPEEPQPRDKRLLPVPKVRRPNLLDYEQLIDSLHKAHGTLARY